MTGSKFASVMCDGCGETYDTILPTVTEVRKSLPDGWTYEKGGRDFCPDCSGETVMWGDE